MPMSYADTIKTYGATKEFWDFMGIYSYIDNSKNPTENYMNSRKIILTRVRR